MRAARRVYHLTMSKRAGPPLFELLRKQSETPPPASPAPPRAESETAVPWSGAGVTRAERSAATFEDEPRSTGELRVPMTRVYMAVALVMLLLVGAWAAGHRVGFRSARAELDRVVGAEPVVPPVRSPGQIGGEPGQGSAQTGSVQTGATQIGNRPTQTDPAPRRSAQQQPLPAGTPWVLTAGGTRAADPRTPNSNYLALATLPADQAQDAIDFLAGKGLRAVGVPVDSGSGAANNPARYTLFSLGLAVPSGQFSSTLEQRRTHERLVAGYGAEWRRERRGGSDFSQTQWSRYNP